MTPGDRLLGRMSAQHEAARLAVVDAIDAIDAIDAAIAAGVPAEDVDAVLARIRAST